MTALKPAAVVVAAALCLPAAAVAMSITVAAADLDLGSRAGIGQLDQRIATAVTSICGTEVATADNWPEVRKCRRDAFASTRVARQRALAAADLRPDVTLAAR